MSAPQFPVAAENPCGLDGIDFVEFVSPDPDRLEALFLAFGFSKVLRHRARPVDGFRQGDITFFLNRDPQSFAARFGALHGPSLCSMGWRVADGAAALRAAVARGGTACADGDLWLDGSTRLPALYGIGASALYFVDDAARDGGWARLGFGPHPLPVRVPEKGFTHVDHLTNNVEKGTLARWAHFYRSIFGFEEVRYFDIRGARTGLTSFALRSPCGRFCIPINEASEKQSQINEYLDEYRGPGVQHLAFATDDLLASLRALDGTPIQTLDIEGGYYAEVFQRVPGVTEDRAELQRRNVLVDGDEHGYLLQLFTKNLIGPIFIELIQRKNHASFGEGNFGALFRSIERDQARRGVFA